jgi:hypothetical protein
VIVKTDKNFKFPQKYKLLVRLTKGSDELRSLWKKSFIEATLAEEDYKKSKISKEKRD